MSRRIKIATTAVAGALGLIAIGAAAPAGAYYGGCYKDPADNCYLAPRSLSTAKDAPADLDAFGTTPDQHFAYLVTHDDDTPEFKILDFAALKEHAMLACQLRTNGARALDATRAVQNSGGYTFQQAGVIEASAVAVYCSSVIPPPPGR
jgi:hypothetical protein